MSAPGTDPWGTDATAAPAPVPANQNTAPDPWSAQGQTVPDSPYLGMAEQLERSQAAADAWNRAHPDQPKTVDQITSPKGAVGRYQVMPQTAQLFGLDPNQLTDPTYNRLAANLVLQELSQRYGQDRGAIAVAYNAGPAVADRWIKSGRQIQTLPAETRDYMERATDPWSPDWTAPPPASPGKLTAPGSMSAPSTMTPPVKPGIAAKPEASWAAVLSPNIASAWDRIKQAGLGMAEQMVNQDPSKELESHLLPPGIAELAAPYLPSTLTPAQKSTIEQNRAPVNSWFAKTRSDVAQDIQANTPALNPGTAKNYTYQTLAGITDMVPALAAVAVTKNPVVGAAIMGEQAGGDKYAEAMNSGRTHDQAAMDATFSTMVNGGMGLLPMHVLMKPGGTFLSTTLKNAGAFGVQSVATEAMQIGYDKGLVTPDMTLKEAWGRLEQAGITGTLTGALLGGGHAGLESAYAKLHANTPAAQAPPQPRVEPTAAPTPAGAQAPPTRATAGPIQADLEASIGLRPQGGAPPDPWAPAGSNVAQTSPSTVPESPNNAETAAPPPQQGFTTNPAKIRQEHELEMAQLGGEGSVAAARRIAPVPSLDTPAEPQQEAASPVTEGIPRRPLDQDVAITATGRQVPVRYAVVEAAHLVPSQTQDGAPNPNFPADLQPRDRTRAVSQAQVASIAQNINPRLLDRSVNASDGAPIISSSGIVESGNGRSLALQRAYAEGLPSAEQYRDYLGQQGYPVEGMTAPVLVRVREGDMALDDRQAFVREANQSGQLGYSATERAMGDAAALPDSALDLYRGGDVEAGANRDFVRAFMRSSVPGNERAGMIDPNGGLSQDAVRRVRAALLAKAYASPDLVSGIVESHDSNIKAIGGALTDAAADWARMRAQAVAGNIPRTLDQTGKLLEAVQLVQHARAEGRNVAEYVAQPDIFTGEAIDPDVEGWLRLMFRNTRDWTQPVGREKLADSLRYYAQEALKVQPGQNLLGLEPASAAEIASAAKERQGGQQPAPTTPSLGFGEGVRQGSGEGAGSVPEAPAAGRGSAIAPNRDQAAALATGELIQGPFAPQPKEFAFKVAKEGEAVDLGDELARYLAASKAGNISREIAAGTANYILARGRETGHETLAAIDLNGSEPRARTDGQPRAVLFDAALTKGLLDPASRIVTFHNHPSNSSFSKGDIATLNAPGQSHMVVVAHDGTFYAAKLAAKPLGGGKETLRGLQGAWSEATGRVHDVINPLFQDGRISADDAQALLTHGTGVALDRAGIIDYLSSREVPAAHAEMFEKAVKDAANAAIEIADGAKFLERVRSDADRLHRPAEPVRFADGIARIFGGEQGPDGAAGRGRLPVRAEGDGRRPKPVQLKLLEDENRYEDEAIPHGFSETPTTAPSRPLADLKDKLLARAADAAEIVRAAQMAISPMTVGDKTFRATAKDFANLKRLSRDRAMQEDHHLQKDFTPAQRKAMFRAADEQSIALQQGKSTDGIGLSKLTPEERAAVERQQADAQSVWNAMKQAGMVQGEGIPSYVPHLYVEMAETGAKRIGDNNVRSIPGMGKNLTTSSSHMKQRKYLTGEEGSAALSQKTGKNAQMLDDIRTLPLATMRMRDALAGRALINKVKELSAAAGGETVVEGSKPNEPGWFTMDHPAFSSWRPKFITDKETGKITAAKDQNGETIFEKVPIYVRGDFEGPLRAVLSQDSGKVYGALMSLKGKVMNNIMFSPLVQLHLMTELGRALPVSPLKVITLKILFDGNKAKQDQPTRTEAIMHGLVPISHQGAMVDISSIAEPDNIRPGRSWTAQIAGAIPGWFDPRAGDTVKRGIDQMGDFLHNTLLWNRVQDLQFGLYTTMRDHLVEDKKYNPDTAQFLAAHWANRYAGTLPVEAMSTMSRKIANIALFSRTYTLGNLGVVKDAVLGLPLDVQAQIERAGGAAELQKAVSTGRRKTAAILAVDVALLFAANSLIQNAFAYFSGRQTGDQILQGYADRMRKLGELMNRNPLAVANPIADMERLSATSENEIDESTGQPLQRILVGYDKQGTAIYARNPFGKFGEEMANWIEAPGQTFKSKLSPFVKPGLDALSNDQGFGRHLYNAGDPAQVVLAKIAQHYMEAQIPMDQISAITDLAQGKAKSTDALKLGLRTVGVTVRRGFPGGPAAGLASQVERAHFQQIDAAMPAIMQKIKDGDTAGARADMTALHIPPRRQLYYIQGAKNPGRKAGFYFNKFATPEERAQMQDLRGAQQ